MDYAPLSKNRFADEGYIVVELPPNVRFVRVIDY